MPWADGKQAARNIDERLMDEQRWDQPVRAISITTRRARESPASAGAMSPANCRLHEPRADSQEEVVTGSSAEEALDECRRCLRCDAACRRPGVSSGHWS